MRVIMRMSRGMGDINPAKKPGVKVRTIKRKDDPNSVSMYAKGGKVKKVLTEFKEGKLHAGSKKGPKVKDRKQAIAIALSEQRRAKSLQGYYK